MVSSEKIFLQTMFCKIIHDNIAGHIPPDYAMDLDQSERSAKSLHVSVE